MNWIKKGLIYNNIGQSGWRKNSALTPTPILINNKIRIYAGFRDSKGISRIGYVDLNPEKPSEIISISERPVLDIGTSGAFDDNGVILGDVIKIGDEIRMYYVGFQIVKNVKFLAFTGLAISKDEGNVFIRVSNTPILDRTNNELYIRAIHTVIFENNKWKAWYASGNKWQYINEKSFPSYNINYLESEDGIKFSCPATLCIDVQGSEYRIGRPRIYKLEADKYIMFFTKGTIQGDYSPGVAYSKDGINWIRRDEKIGIQLSDIGWDSQSLCYPSLLQVGGKVYMFYNGNNMGKEGFGYAELDGELWA